MSEYLFDESMFKQNFNVKDDKDINSYRLSHSSNNLFKLFPYKAATRTASPIVYDMSECVSSFFRFALGISSDPIVFEKLFGVIKDKVDIEDDNLGLFKNIIKSMFFKDGNFYGYNVGLYPYQTSSQNKNSETISEFLFCIFGLDNNDKETIKTVEHNYSFNVLEKLVIDSIETKSIESYSGKEKYFKIIRSLQNQFKLDFSFMLSNNMTSVEDLSNILSFYYFYYVSQTCLALDQFGNGDRNRIKPIYFALDWEKISRNRKCCEEGWSQLRNNISRMYSHAVTLEIINQKTEKQMMDYLDFKTIADMSEENDEKIAQEIKKAESCYISYIGDCPTIKSIPEETGANKTDAAIRHLFKCVNTQFLYTDRNAPYKRYSDKFEEFCKLRFVKNRKKSGLTLNLTERDIIFLTKLVIQNKEKIRLNDLYKEYENRGIYLDSTSKSLLQDYFTRLNLIDKKSDSGDAQYVKRIL